MNKPLTLASSPESRTHTVAKASARLAGVLTALLVGGFGCADPTGPGIGNSDGGTGGACTRAADCPGADTECGVRTCTDGVCGMLPLKGEGVELASQLYGDCRVARCDGAGGVVQATDATDAYDDGNPCTLDTCLQGETVHPNQAAGFACGAAGETCNSNGRCVFCNVGVAGSCPAGYQCVASPNYTSIETRKVAENECVPASCLDGVKNGSETDVDCGGPACGPCADGKTCKVPLDCGSVSCDYSGANPTFRCLAPTCYDGAMNGAETWADFGGPDCPPVPPAVTTAACLEAADCATNVCEHALCRPPSCFDAVQNGQETGVDCGGTCDAACLVR